MKKVYFALTLCLGFCLYACSCNAKDVKEPISKEQLPEVAQAFINSHFADAELLSAVKEIDGRKIEYDVYFRDGSKLNFDKVGNWEEVDCKVAAVPAGVIPLRIAEVVGAQYPNCIIVKISKDPKKWEVELNNDIDIEFDNNFNIVKVD